VEVWARGPLANWSGQPLPSAVKEVTKRLAAGEQQELRELCGRVLYHTMDNSEPRRLPTHRHSPPPSSPRPLPIHTLRAPAPLRPLPHTPMHIHPCYCGVRMQT
jgi:hypothetical protein